MRFVLYLIPDKSYLGEDHGGDFLRGEALGLAKVLDLYLGVAVAIVNNLEGPCLAVLLDNGVVEWPADEAPAMD